MESQASFHNRIEDIQSNPGSEEKIVSISPPIQTQPKNSQSVGGLSFLVENISHGSPDDYDDVIEKVTNPSSKSEQNSSQSERPFDNIPEISKRSPVDFWKSKTLSFLDSSKSTTSSNSGKPADEEENPNNVAIDESESEFIAELIPPSKSPVKEPATPEKKSLQPLDLPEDKIRRSPRHSQKNVETVEISDLLNTGILPVGSEMNMLGEEGIITKDGWIQYGDQKYSSFDLWFEAVCPRIGCVPSNFKPEERWTMVYVGECPLSDFRTEYLNVVKFIPKSRRRRVFDEVRMENREKRLKQKKIEGENSHSDSQSKSTKDAKNKNSKKGKKSTESSNSSDEKSHSDSENSTSHKSAKNKHTHKSSQEQKSKHTSTASTHNDNTAVNDKKHVSTTAVKVKEEHQPVKVKQEKPASSTPSTAVKIKQEPSSVPPVEVVPPPAPQPQPIVPTVLNSNNSPVLKSVKPEPPQRNNSPPWITSPKKKKSASQSTDDGAVTIEEETVQRPSSPTKNFQKQKSHEDANKDIDLDNENNNNNNNVNTVNNNNDDEDDEVMQDNDHVVTDSELMNDSEQKAKTWTRKRKRAAGDESDWVPKRRKKGEVSDNTVQTTFDNFAKPAPKPKSNPSSPVKPLTRVKSTSPTKTKSIADTSNTNSNNDNTSVTEPMQLDDSVKKSTSTTKEKKSPKKTKQTQLVLDTSGIVTTNKEKEVVVHKSNVPAATPKSPMILGSGLKSTMLTQIIALTAKLGGSIAKEGSEPFTHLVILPNKDNKASRTIKYLTALLKGRWIVSFEWILRSQAEGKWMDEEEFEINGDAVANGTPERARGIPKKANEAIPVLKGYEFYFFGKFEAPLPSLNELSSLIQLAGGKVLHKEPSLPTSMKEILNPTSFLICNEDDIDTIKELQIRTGREALSVQWLLDSISRLKAQELREYKLIQEESEDPLLATQNSLAY